MWGSPPSPSFPKSSNSEIWSTVELRPKSGLFVFVDIIIADILEKNNVQIGKNAESTHNYEKG